MKKKAGVPKWERLLQFKILIIAPAKSEPVIRHGYLQLARWMKCTGLLFADQRTTSHSRDC